MASYVLSWPGLPELPLYIIDPKTKTLYTSENPIPSDRSDLDVIDNRYVKLSSILNLFAPAMLQESQWMLSDLQKQFDVKAVMHLSELCNTSPTDKAHSRKVTSYLPVATLLAFVVVWPACAAFQAMRKALLSHLDHFSESVCRDCGYIQRDCKCDRLLGGTTKRNAFIGYGSSMTEKGTQTELMFNQTVAGGNPLGAVGSGIQGQGISVLLPSGVKMQGGMKIPVSLSSSPMFSPTTSTPVALNMSDAANNPYGYMKSPLTSNIVLPQTTSLLFPHGRSHKRGRPPVTPIPYLYQSGVGYQPNMAFFGSLAGDMHPNPSAASSSLLQFPQWQSILPVDPSQSGFASGTPPSNINLIRPLEPTTANAVSGFLSPGTSTAVYCLSNSGEIANRKRKFSCDEADLNERNLHMKNVGIQTLTKSFTKKCKLKEEKLADKTDGTSRISASAPSTDETKDSSKCGESGSLDFESASEPSLNSRQSSVDNLISPSKNSMHADVSRLGKDDRDVASKKFGGKLWRQLEDSSDDDKQTDVNVENLAAAAGRPDTDLGVPENNEKKINGQGIASVQEENRSSVANVEENDLHSLGKETSNSLRKNEEIDKNDLNHPVPSTSATLHVELDLETPTNGKNSQRMKKKEQEGDVTANKHNMRERLNSEVELPVADISIDEDNFKVLPDRTDDSPSDHVHNNPRSDTYVPKAIGVDGEKFTDSNETKSGENTASPLKLPAPRKIYGKFEYMPTQEHIFRCLIPKCSQSFDTRLAAELHNTVHPEGENSTQMKCPDCDFVAPFYHWFDLLRHMSSKHEIFMSKAPFSCTYCGLVFENEESLCSHIDFHYSNRYKCVHCGLLLLTWGQVKRHLEGCTDKHRGNINLGCPYCTFVFHKKNIRNLHLLSHSDSGLVCSLCQDDVSWADWKTLRKHYQQKHAKILQGKISPFQHKLPQKRKPPRCKKCEIDFRSMEQYSTHMMRDHDFIPYTLVQCAQCGSKFRTAQSHDFHVKNVHAEEIPCEKCDFVATSKAMMKTHITQKHSDKQLTCFECDKSFTFYHQLKVHLAHHARRSIIPCQKCDQEFSRQSDLKQHMIHDHSDTSDKGPQTCPECDLRFFSRLNLNTHIKKNHPELLEDKNTTVAAVVPEEEEEGADHCYFNKKVETQPAAEPSKVRRVGRRKGRQKKAVMYEWDRTKKLDGAYLAVEDRRERRRLKRLQKEQDDRMKKLKKSTCARTRSYFEHQDMKNGGKMLASVDRERQLQDRHLHLSRIARASGSNEVADDYGAVESIATGIFGTQPYLDHSYCKLEGIQKSQEDRVRLRIQSTLHSQADESVVDTPDVSAFQECETLGLGGSTVMRKRGRPPNSSINRPILDARRKFTSVLESVSTSGMQASGYQTMRLMPRNAPSTSTMETTTTAADDEVLENLSSEIADFELITESDLLKNLGGYSLIDELLGMTHGNDGATKKSNSSIVEVQQAGEPKFSDHSHRVVSEANSMVDNSFSDGLVIDSETPLSADFDDIDLGEDVYSLFMGGGSGGSNGQGGSNVSFGSGEEASVSGVGVSLVSGSSAIQHDILSLTPFPASVSLLTSSPSHNRGLVSPRRVGNLMSGRNVSSLQQSTVLTVPSISAGTGSLNASEQHTISLLTNQSPCSAVSSEISLQPFTVPLASAGLLPTNVQQNMQPGGAVVDPSAYSGESYPRGSSLTFAMPNTSQYWRDPCLDTSGLLSLSEAANLHQSSDPSLCDGVLMGDRSLNALSVSRSECDVVNDNNTVVVNRLVGQNSQEPQALNPMSNPLKGAERINLDTVGEEPVGKESGPQSADDTRKPVNDQMAHNGQLVPGETVLGETRNASEQY